jgi:hypothetical protein
MPAFVANEATACSASCGSNAGLPSASDSGSGTSHERAPGEVEGDLHERLVERELPAGEATDAGFVAERFAERLTERDGDVLDGVVGVDVEVAHGLDGQVEATVAAELVEHVVVERDARRAVGLARAVEIDGDLDGRLLRRATAGGGARHEGTPWLRRAPGRRPLAARP